MNRDEKIRAIEEVKAGIPAHFALNRNKYKCLYRNQSEDFFWTDDGQKVSKEDQEKYFSDSIIFVNVSNQYKYDENGEIKELEKD